MSLRRQAFNAIRRYDRDSNSRRGLVSLAAFSCALQEIGIQQGSRESDEIFRHCEMAPDGYVWYSKLDDEPNEYHGYSAQTSPRASLAPTIGDSQDIWDAVGPSLRQKFQLWDANTISNEAFVRHAQELLETDALGPTSQFVQLLNKHRFTRAIRYNQVMTALRKDVVPKQLVKEREQQLVREVRREPSKVKIVAAGGAPSNVASSMRQPNNSFGRRHYSKDADETASVMSWDSASAVPAQPQRPTRKLAPQSIPEHSPPWAESTAVQLDPVDVQHVPKRVLQSPNDWFGRQLQHDNGSPMAEPAAPYDPYSSAPYDTPPHDSAPACNGAVPYDTPPYDSAPACNGAERWVEAPCDTPPHDSAPACNGAVPYDTPPYDSAPACNGAEQYAASPFDDTRQGEDEQRQYRNGAATGSGDFGSYRAQDTNGAGDTYNDRPAGQYSPMSGQPTLAIGEFRPTTAPCVPFDQRSVGTVRSVGSEAQSNKLRMRGGHGNILSWGQSESRDLTPQRSTITGRRLNSQRSDSRMSPKTALW